MQCLCQDYLQVSCSNGLKEKDDDQTRGRLEIANKPHLNDLGGEEEEEKNRKIHTKKSVGMFKPKTRFSI